ncbi:MAG: NAD(P)H-binding protein [Desulfosalsimonas sp.]|uniref:NAD(P)H-binding protein n=1 Tax=Desulfosalsimonas sp. TaxID=3073848 RepID=UPI003970C881
MKSSSSPRILITGATGFIGRRLLYRLDAMGFWVRCMTRKPEKFSLPFDLKNPPEVVAGDLLDPESLKKALDGIDIAYYLVHSMGGKNFREMKEFEKRDRTAAQNFVNAADQSGLSRLIYLGGLGEMSGSLSHHLASRQEVGKILASGKTEATILRAAVIIGAGGAGFEIIRYLVERLPVMLCPKWIYTQSQPIAVENVLDYLAGCLEVPETAGATFDIGGPEVLTYAELIKKYARVRGLRRYIAGVPFFYTLLSTYWVALITPVPPGIVFPLAEGLRSPAVCRENQITGLIPLDLISMEQAICNALAEEQQGPGRLVSRQACFLPE